VQRIVALLMTPQIVTLLSALPCAVCWWRYAHSMFGSPSVCFAFFLRCAVAFGFSCRS
jgi:hypothetical protein